MRAWTLVLIAVSTVLTLVSLVLLCLGNFFTDPSSLDVTYSLKQINMPVFSLSLAGTVIAMIMGGIMFFYYINDEFDEHEYKFVPLIICAALVLITGIMVILLPGNAGVVPAFISSSSQYPDAEVVFGAVGNAFLVIRTLGIAGFTVAAVISAIELLGYY